MQRSPELIYRREIKEDESDREIGVMRNGVMTSVEIAAKKIQNAAKMQLFRLFHFGKFMANRGYPSPRPPSKALPGAGSAKMLCKSLSPKELEVKA
jgi:hypothetical protein